MQIAREQGVSMNAIAERFGIHPWLRVHEDALCVSGCWLAC